MPWHFWHCENTPQSIPARICQPNEPGKIMSAANILFNVSPGDSDTIRRHAPMRIFGEICVFLRGLTCIKTGRCGSC